MKIQALSLAMLAILIGGSTFAADAEQTGFGQGLGQGQGRGNGELREKIRQKILAKFDTNHDGKLEPDELAALKAAIQKWRENHKGQGQGMGKRHQFGNGAANKSSDNGETTANATKVDVQKAIEQDTKPDQVSF
jgi:hypothetical protein